MGGGGVLNVNNLCITESKIKNCLKPKLSRETMRLFWKIEERMVSHDLTFEIK